MRRPRDLHTRLSGAPRGISDDGGARAAITEALVAAITAINTAIAALVDRIEEQLPDHPDQAVFTSLPRSRQNRAARLLASRSATPAAASPPPTP